MLGLMKPVLERIDVIEGREGRMSQHCSWKHHQRSGQRNRNRHGIETQYWLHSRGNQTFKRGNDSMRFGHHPRAGGVIP